MSPVESSEPTTFALDVYFAAGTQGDATLAAHVASCARCAAYLAQLSALQQAAPLLPMAVRPPPRRRNAPRLAAISAAVSACAAVVLWLRSGDYVGSKGVPAVQALIRGSDQARVWDGKTPLHAGDAIALRTACDRYTRVAVVVVRKGARGDWERVFDGRCSEQEPLPFTLVADDKPGSERIQLVFSRAALDDAALRRALERGERSETVWVNELVLQKAGAGR
jgi:hypothetical protein